MNLSTTLIVCCSMWKCVHQYKFSLFIERIIKLVQVFFLKKGYSKRSIKYLHLLLVTTFYNMHSLYTLHIWLAINFWETFLNGIRVVLIDSKYKENSQEKKLSNFNSDQSRFILTSLLISTHVDFHVIGCIQIMSLC